ncbi:MAG: hypothetical protein ACYTGC_13810, partial [Planctomycetota bacterium]
MCANHGIRELSGLSAACVMLSITLPVTPCLAGVVTWDGGGDGESWNDGENWSNDMVPDIGDDVVIDVDGELTVILGSIATVNSLQCQNALTVGSGGLLEVDTASSIATLNLVSGVVQGFGDINITQQLCWTGGQMFGPGVTTIDGMATVTVAITLPALLARPLNNHGTINWVSGSVTFDADRGQTTTLTNMPGGEINIQGSGTVGVKDGNARLVNMGLFNVSGASTVFDIAHPVDFDNEANVFVLDQAQLRILSANGSNSGSFDIEMGSVILLGAGQAGYTFEDGAFAAGEGLLDISGFLAVNGNVEIGTLAALKAGDLDVAQSLCILRDLAWTDGRILGAGTITVAADATMSIGGGGVRVLASTLINQGTITWTGAQVQLGDVPDVPGTITNHMDAVFTIDAGTTVGLINNGGPSVFSNMGMITKDDAQVTEVGTGVEFTSSGDIFIASGTVKLFTSVGMNTGSIILSNPGAALEVLASLAGDGYDFAAGTDVTGNGCIRIIGRMNATADFTICGSVEHQGALDGPGIVTILDDYTWTGGDMEGTGRLVLEPGSMFTLAGGNMTLHRELENRGMASFESGNLVLSDGIFNNCLTGIFECNGGNTIARGGGSARFNNVGTFIHADPSMLTVGSAVEFDSTGSVWVQDGVLRVLSIEGTNTGLITISLPGVLRYEGQISQSTYTLGKGTAAAGDGCLEIAGRVLVEGEVAFRVLVALSGTLDGTGTAIVTGVLVWETGTMTGTGTTRIAGDATAEIVSGGKTLDRTMEVAGVAEWLGGQIGFTGNALLHVLPDGVFSCTGGTSVPSFAGAIANNGLFLKSTANTTSLNTTFTNRADGVVQIEDGELYLAGGFTNFEGTTLTGGTYVISGVFRFNFADIVTNAATIRLIGPTAQIVSHTGADALANLATVAPGGELSVEDDTLNVPGDLTNLGDITVDVGGEILIDGEFLPDPGSKVSILFGDAGPLPLGGVAHGRIAAVGAVPLAGELQVQFEDGIAPSVGSTFDIITGNTVSGMLGCAALPVLDKGTVAIDTFPDRVTLEVLAGCSGQTRTCRPCRGDTDGDGVVGVDDLIAVILDWNTDGCGHQGDVDGSGL